MTRDYKAYAILLVVVLASGLFLMSKSSPREVNISVVYGTNDQLVLNIRNTTTNTLFIDSGLRESFNSRFDWELFSGQRLVAKSGKPRPADDLDRFICSLDMGPIDIYSGRFIQIELENAYPEFADKNLLRAADTLLWHYRVWDMDAKKWIQAQGMVQLKHR